MFFLPDGDSRWQVFRLDIGPAQGYNKLVKEGKAGKVPHMVLYTRIRRVWKGSFFVLCDGGYST